MQKYAKGLDHIRLDYKVFFVDLLISLSKGLIQFVLKVNDGRQLSARLNLSIQAWVNAGLSEALKTTDISHTQLNIALYIFIYN